METTLIRTRSLVQCGLFAALIAVGAFIQIPIPSMDYFTMQFIFVILSGMLLGSSKGAISAGVYVLIGLVGFPVFAAGGGISYIFRPTFGYLIGFILAAWLSGLIVEKSQSATYKTYLWAAFSGLVATYFLGYFYKFIILNFYMGTPTPWPLIFLASFPLDLPGDILLCFLGAAFIKKVKPLLRGML
ncbi:MAG: biotin transporter BioY [Eubacterium sp.]